MDEPRVRHLRVGQTERSNAVRKFQFLQIVIAQLGLGKVQHYAYLSANLPHVTSIQCVSQSSGQETWSNLPLERARLFRLIDRTSAGGVLLISGDRHWSELSVARQGVPYPLYDLTSSSFNQLHGRGTPTDNKYRDLPTTFHKENYGAVVIDWKQDDPLIRLEIRHINGKTRLE